MLQLNNITLIGIGGTPDKNEFDTLFKIPIESQNSKKCSSYVP
jgi:hypothetical protein